MLVLLPALLLGCEAGKITLDGKPDGTSDGDRAPDDTGADTDPGDPGDPDDTDPDDTDPGDTDADDSGGDPADTSDPGDDTGETPDADCAPYGLVADAAVSLVNGASIDAYDSARGAWGGANASADATVAVNDAADCALTVGGTLSGDAWIGSGGTDEALCLDWGGNVSGRVSALPSAVAMPTVALPGGLPVSIGDRSVAWGETWTLSGDTTVDDLTVASGATLEVTGDTVLSVAGDLSAAGTITVAPGATLALYVRGRAQLGFGAAVNSGGEPARLRLTQLGGDDLVLDWGSALTAVVEQPGGTFTNNGGAFSGTWIGERFATAWGATTHVDTARLCP